MDTKGPFPDTRTDADIERQSRHTGRPGFWRQVAELFEPSEKSESSTPSGHGWNDKNRQF